MNKERILALADLIERQPHTGLDDTSGFNMADYTHDCGTPACIAGWAVAMSGEKTSNKVDIHNHAILYLGISEHQASDLFIWARQDLDEVTPEEAAATLRRLAETGKVDWARS